MVQIKQNTNQPESADDKKCTLSHLIAWSLNCVSNKRGKPITFPLSPVKLLTNSSITSHIFHQLLFFVSLFVSNHQLTFFRRLHYRIVVLAFFDTLEHICVNKSVVWFFAHGNLVFGILYCNYHILRL